MTVRSGGVTGSPLAASRTNAAQLVALAVNAATRRCGRAAAAVGLSTSWFLHLFAAQAGTSFRRYRSWARLLLVVGSLSRGSDLTTAAVEAGFASPSHLSDTVRRMFGLTATRLLGSGPRLVVPPTGP